MRYSAVSSGRHRC